MVAVLIMRIPDPLYRWKDELQARSEVLDFLATDQMIAQRWQELMSASRRGGASFEELAGRIESDITMEYQQSFEQLSALNLDAAAPSAETVAMLTRYAQLRSEASHMLAEGIRLKNQKMINEALEKARQAPYLARGEKPPPATPQP
jgi:rhomboid protease GluP